MSLLIHATVTIAGEKDALGACEARLRRLLSSQFLKDEVTEHHGREALCYDLKIEGGIPFPVFAQASQEFPGLEFTAEWVNVAAGEKGRATLVNGRVTEQTNERVATLAGDELPVYIEVAPEGKLLLALTLIRAARDEWRGYALTATRDALLRLVRRPESDETELYSTEGGTEWTHRWRGRLAAGRFERNALNPPVAIEEVVYRELEQLARRFTADWVWFATEGTEETAVERERYARDGYPLSAANVRTSRLHRMRAEARENAPLVHSTLGPNELWVRDLVIATWVTLDEEA